MRQSYLYNGNPYAGKTTSLYWYCTQVSLCLVLCVSNLSASLSLLFILYNLQLFRTLDQYTIYVTQTHFNKTRVIWSVQAVMFGHFMCGLSLKSANIVITFQNFSALYLSCDMESDGQTNTFCRLRQDSQDHFDWSRTSGRTPSGAIYNRRIDNFQYPVTGPDGAQEGNYYAFIESSGKPFGLTAVLVILIHWPFITWTPPSTVHSIACQHMSYML